MSRSVRLCHRRDFILESNFLKQSELHSSCCSPAKLKCRHTLFSRNYIIAPAVETGYCGWGWESCSFA